MKNFVPIYVVAIAMIACDEYDPKKDPNKSGELRIGVDESYTLMMDSQIYTFEQLNELADILPMYKPEADVIQDLLIDSVDMIIACRTLTQNEKDFLRSKQHTVEEIKLATDGIALVIHPDNPDTNLTMEQVRAIFEGRDSLWSQLNPASANDRINVVFDNARSCNARYIRDTFLGEKNFPANCFAVHSNKEVMDYVKENKNALGVMSVGWISDKDDSTSRSFLKEIKVVAIQNPEASSRPELFRKPVQAYIYDGTYPLIRDVYVIETALSKSVGTSFVKQLVGEKGQLIIKRMGMAPATVAPRQIRIVTE